MGGRAMMLTRFHPAVLNEWNRLQNEMTRLWGDLAQTARPGLALSFPPVNLWEDKDSLYVEAELPGLTHDDVEIFVEGDKLTIRGERKPLAEDGRWHRQERGFGKFQRIFTLPAPVEADKIE